ncbi:MAG: hypothetical protein OEL83_14370 [Desulforhopalus sp.]|nr:hypothetical protein [Desulforhopalus sp.]
MSESPVSETGRQEISIDFFRNEDAPGITRLFRQVYGEGYPIATYYHSEQIITENASGRLISCVARTAAGEVVGHNALVLLDPASHLYENAAGAVLSTFRGQAIFPRLFEHTIVQTGKRFTIEGIIGEPVTNHTHLQKMCLQLNFKESGLEVGLMRAAAYGVGGGEARRVSVLLGYFKHRAKAQTVFLPPVYQDELDFLYAGLCLQRTFAPPENKFPSAGNSQGSMTLFELAEVARIRMTAIGADFQPYTSRLEHQAREKGIVVWQIWLPLASPYAAAAADTLRRQGYFLGGVLPCFANGDSLLMQKVCQEPDWQAIQLFSERAKKIAEMVRGDWQGVQAKI